MARMFAWIGWWGERARWSDYSICLDEPILAAFRCSDIIARIGTCAYRFN